MCGITGIVSFSENVPDKNLITTMTKKLHHRGPDDEGIWIHDSIAFGHARLSIHDLSQAGRQPMFSFNKQWVIVFNGEIYNFLVLKAQLLKEYNIIFVSQTDTEVLINAIALWGIRKTLQHCIGMFAFAAYYLPEKKLYLARDRFGEKPLYYGLQNNIFGFASELKALKPLASLGWMFDVNRDALATYMQFSYVPTPYSIYKNIKKLDVATYLEIDDKGNQQSQLYWDASSFFSQSKFTGNYEAAVDILEEKLKDSLRLQMASDVPLGAFLSGGVDSSAIVSMMQSLSSKKISTFSIGFDEKTFNEAHHAKAVANYLGTNHAELYLSQKEMLNIIPSLAAIYDEPFGDSSQIPTYLVSKMAKSSVSVSLSGDAGDEFFGGYSRYFFAEKVKTKILNNIFSRYCFLYAPFFLLNPFSSFSNLPSKLMKVQAIVSHSKNSEFELYRSICISGLRKNFVIKGVPISIYNEKILVDRLSSSYEEWMMYVDSQTYLVDDILTKVDRASMTVSLETRVPFLDHRIYEFATSLPLSYKIRDGVGKRVLRDVLYKYVPRKLIDRPKMGFGIPLQKWLCQDLRPWAESLLDSKKMAEEGYLNADIVQQYWKEHISGRRDHKVMLWNILMFQAWLSNEN
ncbi:MAG: asparagine synthase (glutamine-hydrolyzing) [Gammaproteobacteria bacterium]|nr:asparagine synthase (glutamine-hydrolyzing) [Gammaproteobacteria bacterium]